MRMRIKMKTRVRRKMMTIRMMTRKTRIKMRIRMKSSIGFIENFYRTIVRIHQTQNFT